MKNVSKQIFRYDLMLKMTHVMTMQTDSKLKSDVFHKISLGVLDNCHDDWLFVSNKISDCVYEKR